MVSMLHYLEMCKTGWDRLANRQTKYGGQIDFSPSSSDFDEQTTDNWDVDMSVYYDKGNARSLYLYNFPIIWDFHSGSNKHFH